MIKLLLLLVVIGLWPMTSAAAGCVQKWDNQTPQQIGAFQLWAQSWAAYEPRRERYNAMALAKAILVNYVQPNCSTQLAALGLDERQYLEHLIAQNFSTATGGIPEYIPQLALMNRLAGPGIMLGLPQQAAPAAVAPVAASQPRAPRVVRHTVVQGCPSCSTAASN